MTGRRPRTAGLALLAAALVVVPAGCGVPDSGEPTPIPASDVPYGLAAPTPSEPGDPSTGTMLSAAGIYLVTPTDVLVLRGRELPDGGTDAQVQALLGQLAGGPSQQELADELSTALPPGIELEVTQVAGGVATVDLAGLVDAPTGEESRLAVGQLVLTATSVPGVTAVRLTRAGEPVDAPLPGGELTSAPLTADAFASLLTPPEVAATPLPGAPTPTAPP